MAMMPLHSEVSVANRKWQLYLLLDGNSTAVWTLKYNTHIQRPRNNCV